MSVHVCECEHNGRTEYHLRYPGMTQAEAQNWADKINGGSPYDAPTPAQEVTQSEPIYQLQRGDGSWIDQDKASYDYNAQYGINTIRIVYTAPAPAQEPETALQKFTRFKVAETEGNPVEMLRAFCAFAMNSQDWFDVEPFFDLVREAMASRTAVAPAQEVGLTEAERVRCLIASGCIGTVKMTYDSGPYEITRTSINASRLIDAIIAALRAKGAV